MNKLFTKEISILMEELDSKLNTTVNSYGDSPNVLILNRIQEAIIKMSNDIILTEKWDLTKGTSGIHLYLPFEEINSIPPLRYYQEEALNILKLLVQNKFIFSKNIHDRTAVEHFTPEPAPRSHIYDYDNKQYHNLIINLPTASGKTRIFQELLSWNYQNYNLEVIVITSPTISLLRQIENRTKTFLKEHNCLYDYKVVCSDSSSYNFDDHEDEELKKLLLERGEATTNVKDIENILQNHKEKLIIFSTYASLKKIAQACSNLKITTDFLIADEGHRMCDLPAEDNLDQANFPVKYKAFFTATVREKISNSNQSLNRPMSNKNYFGPIAYKKTPQELINEGFILPPYFLPIDWNQDYADKLRKRLDQIGLDVKEDIRHEFALFVAGLLKVFDDTKKIKNIAFTQSIDVAEWYVKHFHIVQDIINEFAGQKIDIKHFIISQKVEGPARDKLLKEFSESKHAILFNYQVIKEGIDVDNCNSITWLRKMDALGLTQSMGRAMRKDPNDKTKKYGYIICPINIDSKKKGEVIKNMLEIADTLISEGYADIIVDNLNLSNHAGNTGVRGKNLRHIDLGKLSLRQIKQLLDYCHADGKIDPNYYLTDKDKKEIENLNNLYKL